MREIRGWNIGEVVKAQYMTLDSANIYEEIGSNGEANLPCIYNGLTLQTQSGTGNSIVTFNPGVARCQDLPSSSYTYLPTNAYGTGYPCYIDISVLDSNTVITLATSPSTGYIVATFSISPNTSGAVDYVITGSLAQIAVGSYNPAIHVRLCQYVYAGSTFTLDFTPKTHRDTDLTGLGGVQWNYQNSSLIIDTPASQSGSSIVLNQAVTAAGNVTVQGTEIIQSANQLQFFNSGNTHYTSLQAGANSANTNFKLPLADATSLNQFITSDTAGQLSFASATVTANIAANDSNVIFTSSSNPYQVCTPTAARTYTLPGIVSPGIPWTFVNQSTTAANVITLQTSGSNIIDYVIPSGVIVMIPLTSTPTTAANWLIVQANSGPVAYIPTITGCGTLTNVIVNAYRRGAMLNVFGSLTIGTTTSVLPYFTLPFNADINTNIISTVSEGQSWGVWHRHDSSANIGIFAANIGGTFTYTSASSNELELVTIDVGNQSQFEAQAANVFLSVSDYLIFEFQIPILGWAG